jgi:hypothetical protein
MNFDMILSADFITQQSFGYPDNCPSSRADKEELAL